MVEIDQQDVCIRTSKDAVKALLEDATRRAEFLSDPTRWAKTGTAGHEKFLDAYALALAEELEVERPGGNVVPPTYFNRVVAHDGLTGMPSQVRDIQMGPAVVAAAAAVVSAVASVVTAVVAVTNAMGTPTPPPPKKLPQ